METGEQRMSRLREECEQRQMGKKVEAPAMWECVELVAQDELGKRAQRALDMKLGARVSVSL